MGTLALDRTPLAHAVHCSKDELSVALKDGRTVSVPLAWFPRLAHASQKERDNFELLGDGEGIHWPDIDEDISVIGLLAGRGSIERGHSGAQPSVAADR